MRKKILVITGSPREDGNSFAMTDAFIETAAANGHTVVRFDAAEKNVGGCRACGKCFENGKPCAFEDDFNALVPEIESADALVFTMPLYWFSFPAQIKALLDHFHSFSSSEKGVSGKECGLIVCCEDKDIDGMDGIVKPYESMARYLKWTPVGTVLVLGVLDPGDIHKTDGIARARELAGRF